MNIKNKILSNSIYRFLAVIVVSTFSVLEVNAQCGFLPTCPSTDYTNFGIGSNSTASTIEYDNFVSSFHSSVVRTANGEYKVWGAGVANNGTGNLLSPTIIDATNFPAITGSILKAGLASASTTEQGLVLTTNGLFAWGDEGIMIDGAITTSPVFQAITVNGETDGLPVGVNPLDLKMMFTTRGTVAIVTCSGDVYVLTLNVANAGIGGAASTTQWHHVTEVTAGNPFISNVVAIRGQFNTLFALKSDGTLWTWGSETFLGDATASASRNRATQVTLPTANPIKMIGVTRRTGVNASSYFVLNTDGNMYSLGENGDRQLGDWTVTDRLVWVQPRYTSAVGPVMDDIHWISAQEHDFQYAAINVITTDSTNYNWGTNNTSMLGRVGVTVDPGIPGGITVTDKILAVESGGHTSMLAKKCEDFFGYVGHRINGSMGDGTATTATETVYTFATAIVYICGASTASVAVSGTPTLSPGGLYCNGTSTDLLPSPAGGTLSIVSGPATLAGTVITFTGTGNTTVVVQYAITVPGCPIALTATTTLLTEDCNADLSVVKTVDNSTPNVGANVTFTITVNNAGASNAPSVVVNDVLPAGYAFVSATPSQGTWTAPNWNAGTINNGSSANIVIVATVLATGSYANTATVTSALPDPILANNTSTVTPVPVPCPSGTITYAGSPYCTSVVGAQAVTQTATAGGTYTVAPAGLTINAVTGAVTPSTSTAGTYTVTYTIAASGGCPIFTTTASVTITAAPTATITYAGSPFCSSIVGAQAVTRTGTAGGAYTSAPAGLTINAITGAVTPSTSTAGTYTVTYTIAASGGCPVFTTTASVTITAAPTATISYAGSPFCSSLVGAQAVTRTGTAGGTYTSAPAGLTINAGTGAVTPSTSTAGTYTVTYTIAASGGCAVFTTTATVIITANPSSTISFAGSPFCRSLATPQSVTLTGTTGGTFSAVPAGLTINAATGAITPSTSTAGTYTVTYTVAASGGCAIFTTTTSVTITAAPAATISYAGSPFCSNVIGAQAVTRTGTAGGTYTSTPVGLTINAGTGAVTPSTSTAGTYTVTYTIAASGGCAVFTTTTTVIITANPSSTISFAGSPFCRSLATPQSVTLTGTTGGTFTAAPAGLTINAVTGAITPSTSTAGTYTVTYTVAASGGCAIFTTTTSVTITTAPAATISYASPFCNTIAIPQTVTRTGTAGGTYSSAPAGLTINAGTGAVTPSTSTVGTYTVTYTIAASGGCAIFTTTASVTISAPPTVPTVGSNTPVCTGQTINLTATSAGASSYSWTGPNSFSSTLQNPSIINATLLMAGTYSVTASIGTCTSSIGTTTVVINATPSAPTASSNSPVCLTYPINLGASTILSATYNWSGPSAFVSTSQNPIIASATLPMTGTYTVTATVSGCVSLPATVAVITQDCSPSANFDTISVDEDSVAVISVLANDTDPQNNIDTSSVTITDAPNNGTATVGVGGVIIYTPNPNFNGTDTLIYQICDTTIPIPFCDTAIVIITVDPINDAPVVNDTTILTPEDSVITVCLPITDGETGQTYSVSSCGGPLNGTTTTTVIGNQVCVTYTPNPNYSGLDSLCIVVCDNGIPTMCDTAVVNIIVTPTNDPPVVNDTTITIPEDSVITVCLPIADGDTGQTYSVASCGGPLNGSATSTVIGNQVCVTYTPNLNYNGLDSLCIVVCDNGTPSLCDTATVYIIITPVNDPPEVNDTTILTPEDSVITVCLPITDGETGQTYSVSSCGGPLNGTTTTTVIGNQVCVTYTPNPNYNGLDSLCIVVCDDGIPSLCDTTVINIIVTPTNDPPVVNDTIVTIPEDSVITVCLPIADGDTGQTYSVSSCGGPLNGTATTTVIGNQVCVTYTPSPNYNGLDSLCIVVCDNGTPSLCDTAVINIIVTPVNDPPVVNDTIVVTPLDSVVTVCLPISDPDAGQTYSVSACGGPLNGTTTTTVIGNQVCITYTPNSGYIGLDSLCIIICDNGSPSLCDTAVIVIDVQSCTLSNPLEDCDGDGVTNGTEVIDGTDPSNPCDYVFVNQTLTPSLAWNALDCDGDGVTNVTEVADSTDPTNPCDYLTTSITLVQTTNWINADCDGDGVINGTEITDGTDPNNPCDFVLASQTVTPNAAWYLLDCDGDGIPNGEELVGGSNPLDSCSPIVCDFFVPEGFSPNGDGTNDLLVIRGIENYPNNTFTIYNRWGNKVFEGKPYNNTWDGKSTEGIRIGGDELPTGTYFYVLDLGEDSDIIKGFIYLTR